MFICMCRYKYDFMEMLASNTPQKVKFSNISGGISKFFNIYFQIVIGNFSVDVNLNASPRK